MDPIKPSARPTEHGLRRLVHSLDRVGVGNHRRTTTTRAPAWRTRGNSTRRLHQHRASADARLRTATSSVRAYRARPARTQSCVRRNRVGHGCLGTSPRAYARHDRDRGHCQDNSTENRSRKFSRATRTHHAPCTMHHAVSLTTPARTVIDIARSTSFERAVCVGDSALRRRLVTMSELSEALESARHRTGVPDAAIAVAAMTDRSESVGETRSRLILNDAGLYPLLNQSVFDVDGSFLARTDFLHGDVGVVDEFDGEGKYGETAVEVRRAVLDEKHREDRVRGCGWIFARWGWRELSTPEVVIERVRRALALGTRTPPPLGSFRADPLP